MVMMVTSHQSMLKVCSVPFLQPISPTPGISLPHIQALSEVSLPQMQSEVRLPRTQSHVQTEDLSDLPGHFTFDTSGVIHDNCVFINAADVNKLVNNSSTDAPSSQTSTRISLASTNAEIDAANACLQQQVEERVSQLVEQRLQAISQRVDSIDSMVANRMNSIDSTVANHMNDVSNEILSSMRLLLENREQKSSKSDQSHKNKSNKRDSQKKCKTHEMSSSS